MAEQHPEPRAFDPDAHFEFLEKRAKRRYKAQVRKYRRDAENAHSELNLVAMMDMMTILLVFLIKSYGAAEINVAMGDDLMPPTSTSTLQPVQAITVTITKRDISVDSKSVVALVDGAVPAAVRENQLIVPLRDELERAVEKTKTIAEFNPAMKARAGTDRDPTRMLTVVGDKDLDYELLYSVLGTAGQAGLKYFKLLVISSTN